MSSPTGAQSSSISYLQLVSQNPNFRYLWLGQIVSLLGDWFNLIASAALIATLTGSGVAVGGLFVVRSLAPFLVSPFAGVAADRFNRKSLLIITDILRGLLMFGFLFVRDANDVWLLFVLTGLQFAVSGFFFPARNAILPDITNQHELGAANALSSATWSVMLALGTAIGGLVAGWLGVYAAFIIDAFTFFVSAAILALINYQWKTPDNLSRGLGSVFTQYAEGLSYLRRYPDILLTALHKSFIMLLMFNSTQVINVKLAEDTFVIGKDGGLGLGIMFAVIGVGTGIGPIVIRYFTGDRDWYLRLAISVSYAIAIVGLIIAAPLASFPMYLTGSFIRGIGSGTAWVFATQLLMQKLPTDVRGRVFSTEYALFTLFGAVGAGAAGWSIDFFENISTTIWWMAVLVLLPLVAWSWWIVRYRELTEADAVGA